MTKHSRARAYFTAEVGEEILRRLAEGEPLSRICGPDRGEGLPDRITVHRHIRQDKAFHLAYLLARQAQATTLADEIIEIADGLSTPFGQTPNVGRDWLRVHARQWLAGVMAPRTFGRGKLQDQIDALEAEVEEADGRTRLEIAAQIAAILEEARRRRMEITGDSDEETKDVLEYVQRPLPEGWQEMEWEE